MKNDITSVLVESAIRRTLKNIQESPERATRNLIDLGLQFSDGRFQTRLLSQAQRMLQNQDSAYYELVKNTVETVDHNILASFGLNLGYNSCTKGARLIREIEGEKGFNIPWALNLMLNEEKLEKEPDFYPSVLRQGTALGIYTYLLFLEENPEKVLPMVKREPDCAFILFLRGKQVGGVFLEQMKSVKNAMVSVYADEEMEEACRKLRDARLLYSAHQRYTGGDREKIVSGQWLQSILPCRPAFAFLRAGFDCPAQIQREIYQYVTEVRDGQQFPVMLMDVKQDSLHIDQVISDGECLAGFEADGSLRTHESVKRDPRYNIFYRPLEEILRGASIG